MAFADIPKNDARGIQTWETLIGDQKYEIQTRVRIRPRERSRALCGVSPLREQKLFSFARGFLTTSFDAATTSLFVNKRKFAFGPLPYLRVWRGPLSVFGEKV